MRFFRTLSKDTGHFGLLWRRMRVCIAILQLSIVLAVPCSAHGALDQYDVRVEVGGEYDTNAARVEQVADLPALQPSMLARLVGLGSYAARFADRYVLSLSGGVGGKRYSSSSVAGEDVLVIHTQDMLGVRLDERAFLYLSAGYYDAFQRSQRESRAFRSISPMGRWERLVGDSSRLALGVGFRDFVFKSDAAFSFRAPTFLAQFRQGWPGDVLSGAADWEWSAQGTLELRKFEGPACSVQACTGRQADEFATGQVEVVRVGRMLLGGGLGMHLNRSNAFGQSLTRGVAHFRAVVPLPLSLSLSTRLEAVRTQYSEKVTVLVPVSGQASASIEDESRSSLRFELSRMFGDGLELGARYAYYTSAATSGGMEFHRQTILFYLAAIAEP